MSVSIQIINKSIDENIPECQAALLLKENLEKSFTKEVQGSIFIAYGLTLSGQEVRDIDLLVTGWLKGYKIPNFYTNNSAYPRKALIVDNFCYVIELKEHSIDKISVSNTHVYVDYRGEKKDATEQNEKQRYAFMNYFAKATGYKPYVCNALWLKSLDNDSILSLNNGNPLGILPCRFHFKDLVENYLIQGGEPYYDTVDGAYHIKATSDGQDFIQDVYKNLFKERKPSGLTKQKIELLSQKTVEEEVESRKIGKKLTIFGGRAGAGKTFKLIISALKLANNLTGDRALILTYNHALVADIRHMLDYLNIPDEVDGYTVQVQTMQRFFCQLLKPFDISIDDFQGNTFEEKYYKALGELNKFVKDAMSQKDLSCLKEENQTAIDWNYILVDEGQDWADVEKELLFNIYGPSNIIVADGIDQFNRANPKQIWGKGVESDAKTDKRGLRQRANLTQFVNAFAQEMGLNNWNVKPNNERPGGKVIIRHKYQTTLHTQLLQEIANSKCENYDILFLCPHQMTEIDEKGFHHFQNYSKWKDNGIVLFDGTNEQLRTQYSADDKECRLYQYESCRGLEGWCTICMHFDELYENKRSEFRNLPDNSNIDTYAALWSLIPLTRPIDTLVITVVDVNSPVACVLKKLAERFEFVDSNI